MRKWIGIAMGLALLAARGGQRNGLDRCRFPGGRAVQTAGDGGLLADSFKAGAADDADWDGAIGEGNESDITRSLDDISGVCAGV